MVNLYSETLNYSLKRLQVAKGLRKIVLSNLSSKMQKLKKEPQKQSHSLLRIGAIFCICWLPFNILNALMDCSTLLDSMTEEVFCGVYAVCHVLGMSSACANPVIYGFLNENFSKEFRFGNSEQSLSDNMTPDNVIIA